jgi:hypothetical protein
MANGQTFTIGQSTTGSTIAIFGQGFTPSIQGSGTGTVGSQSQVGLYEFSFMLDAAVTPDILYIYEVLPASKEVLIDGTGGTLIGQSINKTVESYWFTNYKFNGLALDKDKMYYALFRASVDCEVGMGDYAGGNLYRLGNDGSMTTSIYANARFKATFASAVYSGITPVDISSISVFPTLTNGSITIYSETQSMIDVYALTGTKMKTFMVNQGQNQKSITDLPKGIYIFISEGAVISKVMKK